MSAASTCYLPELLCWEGAVRSDLGLEVSAEGVILGAVGLAEAATRPGLVHLPRRLLLPGLVNAHSHAFQRVLRGRTQHLEAGREQDDFWSWRELMYRAAQALDAQGVYVASRQAFVEMARAGITAVGEFHYLHHAPDGRPTTPGTELGEAVIRAALDVGLRIVLLRVAYARAGFQVAENPRQRRFIDPHPEAFLRGLEDLGRIAREDPRSTVGAAPHSVRAVPKDWLEVLGRELREGPVHMHVAEQPAEIDACLREHGRRPVEVLAEVGLLTPRFTAVHGVHLEAGELSLLGRAGASVCACPTTERDLGDGIVPADLLHRAGVGLALGSDSQARIDLLEEARALEGHLRLLRGRRVVLDAGATTPDALGATLLHAATEGGARSLGLPTGRLSPGRPADFFSVDLDHPSLAGADRTCALSATVFGAAQGAISDVVVGGRTIVQQGRHRLEEESGRAFAQLCARGLQRSLP